MITKKEDLIGRYALRSDKEVFELFMQKCEEFGLSWGCGSKPRDFDYGPAVVFERKYETLGYSSVEYAEREGYKKLTMPELKGEKQMKIDYELAQKIGATHYFGGDLYKVDGAKLLVFDNHEWVLSKVSIGTAILVLKPIPKQSTRTEYEKVTESIFDLREEFEGGLLYIKLSDSEYLQIQNETRLSIALDHRNVYRKVEKPVDWREEAASFVNDDFSYMMIEPDGSTNALFSVASKIDFPELCRVTLRALGEID